MASLSQDILLDDNALADASAAMNALATRTQNLKDTLSQLYDDMESALQTPAGEALDLTAKDVIIKPIDDLKLIIDHISSTLDTIKGGGYYKDVFDKFSELNQNIKVN